VNAQGVISSIAGGAGTFQGGGGFSGDGGPALQAALLFASPGIVLDSSGNIYFAEDLNFRVRKITPESMSRKGNPYDNASANPS
jgi:hypothetical protein